MTCLHEILRVIVRQNLQVFVQIATRHWHSRRCQTYWDVRVLQEFWRYYSASPNLYESNKIPLIGLQCYLGSAVNLGEDPEVHFKYTQAATRAGQICEAERICRESSSTTLRNSRTPKEAKFSGQLPCYCLRSLRLRARPRPLSALECAYEVHWGLHPAR